MKRIILLTDYKGYFGSKWNSLPYKSGFDQQLLVNHFKNYNFEVNFVEFSDATYLENIDNVPVLYTSSEDIGYHYKNYIEDVIFFSSLKGTRLIPSFKFLRANNNKVFMEMLRLELGSKWGNLIKSWFFGTFEEMHRKIDSFDFPLVIKTAEGAMSRGVELAKNKSELLIKVKRLSRSKYLYHDIKDKLRSFKYINYKIDSLYRNKFIIQSFIPNLKNDWKILIYGNKFFLLTRHIKKGDFRASGSKVNYLAGSRSTIPDGLLDFANSVFSALEVPHLSIDVAFDGTNFHLIEFQAIYFGSSTVNMSDVYFKKEKDKWVQVNINESLEQIYVESVVWYLNKNND